MGKVYRALDKKLNEEVALKLIKPEISSDKKVIERFRNELKIARKIVHKNVGRMYELMEDEGAHYITMENVVDFSGLFSFCPCSSYEKAVFEGNNHRLSLEAFNSFQSFLGYLFR